MGALADNSRLNIFVDLEGRPERDLALESDFLDRAPSGAVSLFLYSWASPVVVLGYGQKIEDIDLDWCRGAGVPVYRRMTGGTGVVHRRDLAVSLFLPAEHRWAERITGLYGLFLGALAPALEAAGGQGQNLVDPPRSGRNRSPICFEDQLSDTLVADGRKVVGCAQARRSRAVLIHAAVSLNLASEVYAGAFGVSRRRIEEGLGEAVPGGRAEEVVPFVEEALAEALEMRVRHEKAPEPIELAREATTGDLARGGRE
ncbi:MAG: lipoate--protein ligase family protein [Acidobacteria bacterium]|nr:lipoate--protein ligase family protein [Acidobacteriota bacterium]